MITVQQVITLMEQLAPRSYAESWDNVGLMVGDHHYSSKDANPRWKTDLLLDANTHKDKVTGQSIPKKDID